MSTPTATVSTTKKTTKSTTKAAAASTTATPAAAVAAPAPVAVAPPAPVAVATPAPVATETVAAPTTDATVTEDASLKLLEQFNDFTDALSEFTKNMKNVTFSNRDVRTRFDAIFRRFSKASTQLSVTYPELVSKELVSAEKNSKGKSATKKTSTNKDNAAVNKKLPVDDILLSFMGVPAGTQVSRAEALKAITSYVKTAKQTGTVDIKVEGNNRAFKIAGKLQPLFKGIEKLMLEKGDLNKGETVPDKITYIQIMKYMSYCFKKVEA